MMKKVNFLVCLFFALIASTLTVSATNYFKIRVVAVGAEGGRVYAGLWSGWQNNFPSDRTTWPSEFTTGVLASSGNPDVEIVADCSAAISFLGWYSDEECTNPLPSATNKEKNVYGSGSGIAFSTSEADAPTTTFYAKFMTPAADWASLGAVPAAGNFYVYNIGYGGFLARNGSIGLTMSKDHNNALLVTLSSGGATTMSIQEGTKTYYINQRGNGLEETASPVVKNIEADNGFYYVKLNYNNYYWYSTDGGSCSYTSKSTTNLFHRWVFIPEATYKEMISVTSVSENGSITINSSPTASGSGYVAFNVSEVGPLSGFLYELTGGDGHFSLGTPVRVNNVIRVPVSYTAQNRHSTVTPASTATVTLTAKNEAASSASGLVSAYVDLSPQFALKVDELDWSYEGDNLVETYYAGMEVAASQRERLQNKLVKDDTQTTGVAANYATWTATITGEDADQFKFANGTRTVSGPYSASLLDVIFAPTKTSEASVATLHIETSYTDANSVQLKYTQDITLSGKSLDASYIRFAANGNETASENESHDFGSIIGTNSKYVTAELNMYGISSPTKVWDDPAGVFEFDVNSIDFSKSHQVLTFSAHRPTPVTTATNHTATLTVSGTGTEGTVTAVLTLTYQALPLLTPTVTWNWETIRENSTITNPVTTNSDASSWTLTRTAGDAEISYDAGAKSLSAPYLHHEPVTKTATFNLSIPQTNTYAAVNQEYTTTMLIGSADIYIDSPAKFEQYVSYRSTSNTSWIYYTDDDKSVYVWTETIGYSFCGQTKLSFDSQRNSDYTSWQITEYYADGTSHQIYNAIPEDGHHEFEISPEAVEVRFYYYGWMRNIHYYEYDTISADYDKIVLVNDNGVVNSMDIPTTMANKQQVTVSLNATAAQYFELQSAGKSTGSSIVFNEADGLGVYQIQNKTITVKLKSGANAAEAKAATAGNACRLTFADNYTYNHEEHSLPIILMDAYDVVFEHQTGGTYVVTYEDDGEDHNISSSDYVKHLTSVTNEHCTVTLSAPTAADGYVFQGWRINGELVSCKNTHTAIIAEEVTVKAVFSQALGNFKLFDAYFDGLDEVMTAAAPFADEQPVVTLMKDLVLTSGTYTIPAGVSLLIPHKANFYDLQIGPDDIETNSAALEAAAKQISIYRMLTLKDGVNIICNGNICVAGHAASANGGRQSGYVAKACGVINMANGGHIELNNGAQLYCWGFVKGQDMDQGNNTQNIGTITANEGAIAWEDFEMGDWRGGTASSNIAFEEGRMLFPFQSYSLQNIEVPITYKYGSQLMGHATLMALSSVWALNVAIIGSDVNLFLLKDEQSIVRKWYDPTTDLVCFELSGSAELNALVLDLGLYAFNSAEYNLPISNSMHIILTDCNMTLSKPLTVQAGAVLEVKESATVNLEAPVHLYDVDEWGNYIYSNCTFRTFNTISTHKDRGSESLKDGLDDAKLIIDGTLNIVKNKGYLYATTGGANIMGNGGGKIVFEGALPSAGTLWHVTGLDTWGSNDEAAANLCNDDASYTKSTGFTTYYNINGRWFYEENKDQLPNHTYDFYYLDNGNTGEETWTAAVYSHDKTGLEARMKWFNVEADENCLNWWNGTNPTAHYNYTMMSDWHQFLATETESVYSGSDNKLYQKDECHWYEAAAVDENCLYTLGGVKKALVDGHFIPLESNGYDPAYHATADPSQYYICFTGCNWHAATPYVGEQKAYTIEPETGVYMHYIWFNNDWLNVERDELYFYTADEITNVKTYYEYLDGEWIVATPFVSVTDGTETRTFFSFQQALKVASTKNDATITILRDFIEATHSSRTPMEFTKHNTTCTLDLNGHIAQINVEGSSATAVHMLTLNGEGSTFIITDNSPYKLGELHLNANVTSGAKASRWFGIYVQQGELILNAGKVYAENMFTYTSTSNTGVVSAITVAGGKQFTLNGGDIEAKAPYSTYGVHLEGSTITTGKTYINDGTITTSTTVGSSPIGLYIGSGTAYVSGGTINVTAKTTTSRGIYVEGSTSNYIGHLEMTGGTITSTAKYTTTSKDASAIGIYVNGTYTFNNTKPNTIKATFRGVANISGGTIKATTTTSRAAFAIQSRGNTTITGGDFSALPKTTYAYALFVQDGTTTVSGSPVFTAKSTEVAYGVYATGTTPDDKTGRPYNSNVTVNGGTFNVTTTSKTTAYGVYASVATRPITSTASGYYAGNYASAGTVTINDGVFNMSAKTTKSYGVVVAAAKTEAGATGYDAVTATAKATVNGGKFKMTSGTAGNAFAVNASAATENLKVNGGYYNVDGNLATYAVSPKSVIDLSQTIDANYPTYNYKVAEMYTVTFMNGETTLQTSLQELNEPTVYQAGEPTRDNTETNTYIFDGWATEADGAVVYAKGATLPNVTADATYYAHFNETTLKYRVTWNGNGGVGSEEFRYVTPGSKLGTLPTGTRYGYTLKGWYTAAKDGTKIKTTTKPSADVTYYAQWTAIKHNLTWDMNGGVVTKAGKLGKSTAWPAVGETGTQTYNLSYNAAIVAPTVARTGYTFVSWDATPVAKMLNEDVTYTAVWKANTNTPYTVLHKKQNPENLDEYIVDEEATINGTGTTDSYITPATKTYVGYITPATQTVQIAADGSLVVEYLYDLITYTLTFDATTNSGTCETSSVDVKHGATATLPEATRENYTFIGWFTKAVGGDQITNETIIQRNIGTLYAQFKEGDPSENVLIAGDGENITITSDTEADALIVKKDGIFSFSGGAKLTVERLILQSTGNQSGQLVGLTASNLTVTEQVYFDFIPNGAAGTQARTWYAVAVPWEVDAENGIFLGETGRHLTLGRDFDLIYYDVERRAASGDSPECWKYVEFQPDKIMHPGQMYMMYFIPGYETIRFAKKAGSPINASAPDVEKHDAATGETTDANWNGIANPMVYHAYLDAGTTFGQVLNNGNLDDYFSHNETSPVYKTVLFSSYKFVVGKPVFVQAESNQTVGITQAAASPLAPRRAHASNLPDGIESMYQVTIAADGQADTDDLYIQTSENKDDKYVIGQDLVKGGVAHSIAQLWVNRYGVKLSVNTTAAVDGYYTYPLGLSIPTTGEYTIALEGAQGETDYLYLTKDGAPIWNLTNGAYTGTFEAGTTNSYGLRVAAKAPQITTGIDEAVVDAQGETRKVLINDKVFIIRGEHVYSTDGQLVK